MANTGTSGQATYVPPQWKIRKYKDSNNHTCTHKTYNLPSMSQGAVPFLYTGSGNNVQKWHITLRHSKQISAVL